MPPSAARQDPQIESDMQKTQFRFLHAADPHIDSPLRGLTNYDGAPVGEMRGATRKAFESMVDLAIAESVDFVLIAGDLFDGPWEDYATALRTGEQFNRLYRAGVPVFLVRGNHDAASRIEHSIQWPPNVHVFDVNSAHTHCIESLKVAIHGQSYARADETNDLAKNYPSHLNGHFNIGLLHTSLAGYEGHENYAPTSLATLLSHRYDYWALGHVHRRVIVNETQPMVCFSGNMQGRHIRETGEKGVFLVTVRDGNVVGHEFRAVDHLRWAVLEIELTPDDTEPELLEQLLAETNRLAREAENRLLAVRVHVTGMTHLHKKATRPLDLADLINNMRLAVGRGRSAVWLEKIEFHTQPVVDLDEIRNAEGLQSELLRLTDHWIARLAAAASEDETGDDFPDRLLNDWLKQLETWLVKNSKIIPKNTDGSMLIDLRDPELRRQWLTESQQILVNALMSE